MTDIRICKGDDDLAAQAADFIIKASQEAIAARGRFTLAFTGGSSPGKTYGLLAQSDRAAQMDWEKSYLFMGDDRFVPPSDERSNFGMVAQILLNHVPAPNENIFPIPTEAQSSDQAAVYYADTIRDFFGLPMDAPPPALDLVLLGLGDDGHIASLFPGFPTLEVTDRWVVSSPPGTLPPPVDRVTLTFPVINAARQVLFIVNGEKKAPAVQDILEGGAAREKRPAAGVKPNSGEVIWMLDPSAASQLRSRHDV